jgi:hypothetical protein
VLVILTAAAVLAVPLGNPSAHAMTINCMHSGPVIGHPGMEYICYVKNDDGTRTSFYAPGPVVRP